MQCVINGQVVNAELIENMDLEKKMKIARVFPRKTNCTPIDEMAFVGDPLSLFMPTIDEIHISITFTYDLQEVERLKKEWERYAPVKIGGPGIGMKGNKFIPGKYIKKGYVITSRGCRNRCWFCSVWRREGNIRELPITEGINILDDNLLACSEKHIKSVFEMLKNQKGRKQFTGGLEAAILKEWHVKELKAIRPYQIFFAYDTPDDREPLFEAGKLLKKYGFTYSHLRCYCLVGWKTDTFVKAEKRLNDCIEAGFIPMAMLYINEQGEYRKDWKKFQREWVRPAIIRSKINGKDNR